MWYLELIYVSPNSYYIIQDGKQVAIKNPYPNVNNTLERPTARQSEIDVGHTLPFEARAQVSFKNGQEVPYGTAGSVRPDWCIGFTCSIEVKNHNIHTNRTQLIDITSNQAIERSKHLPLGMRQAVWIDLRGQSYSTQDKIDIQIQINQKSNNIIHIENINFIE